MIRHGTTGTTLASGGPPARKLLLIPRTDGRACAWELVNRHISNWRASWISASLVCAGSQRWGCWFLLRAKTSGRSLLLDGRQLSVRLSRRTITSQTVTDG